MTPAAMCPLEGCVGGLPSTANARIARVPPSGKRVVSTSAVERSLTKSTAPEAAAATNECPFHSMVDGHLAEMLNKELGVPKSDAVAGAVDTPGPAAFTWSSMKDVSTIMTKGLHVAMLEFFAKYGPQCRFANPVNLNGAAGWLFINDPDDIAHVCSRNTRNYLLRYLPDIYKFVTHGKGILGSQGRYNTRHRQLCQPPFRSPSQLEKFSTMVTNRSKRVADIFLRNGVFETDISNQTQRLALDIIGDMAFSHDFRETERIERDLKGLANDKSLETDRLLHAVNVFGDILGEVFITPLRILQFLDKLGYRKLQHLHGAIDTIKESMLKIIADRRKEIAEGLPPKDDLLSVLLDARDADGQKMTDDELWEDVHDIMGAGHETTATTTAATIYLISKHPRVQKKVTEELQKLDGQAPSYQELIDGKVQFVSQCVKEALRIYPAIPLFPREASSEDVLPSGHRVQKGDVVFMSTFALGRSPELWDNPMEFRPERFDPDLVEQMHRFQYLPFGSGPRMCLGANFAELSVTLMVANLLQRNKYTPIYPNTEILPIEYDITMNFNKTKGLKMRVEPLGAN